MAKADEIKLNLTNFSAFYRVIEIFDCFLAIFLSIQLLGDPVAGIAISVLFGFFTAFFGLNLRGRAAFLRKSTKIVMLCLFVVVLCLNVATVFFFPELLDWDSAILVLFVLVMTARTMSTDALSCSMENRSFNARFFPLALLHLLFVLLFGAMALTLLPAEGWTAAISATAISVALFTRQIRSPHKFIKPVDSEKLNSVYSFKLYRNMAFYSHLAVFLSTFIYLFYMFSLPQEDANAVFSIVALWLVVVMLFTYTIYRLLAQVKRGLGLGIFILGALVWGVSAFFMFRVKGTISRGWWSLLWAGGSACMFAVTTEFQRRFKLISPLIDYEISDDALMQNTVEMQTLAYMISSALILVIVILWGWFSPDMSGFNRGIASSSLTLLPIVFLVVSIVMAARQPMEDKYERRLNKVKAGEASEELREKMDRTFVKKYKKRYGVRIIMFLLRPILHHKVYGKNHVDETQPAIFVCNHGEIYGPLVSVVYLPFHFRPWVDENMIDKDKIYDHMYKGTFEYIKWMPKWLKRFCTKISSKFCLWALNSFDPIPVYRGNLRAIVKTLELSVEALKADDNILLFPENPSGNEEGRYKNSVLSSSFYTGFAHIAVQFYSETGKKAIFYPIFADKKRRAYPIGEGIPFEPGKPAAEEKRRIAGALHDAMEEMIGENTED